MYHYMSDSFIFVMSITGSCVIGWLLIWTENNDFTVTGFVLFADWKIIYDDGIMK